MRAEEAMGKGVMDKRMARKYSEALEELVDDLKAGAGPTQQESHIEN